MSDPVLPAPGASPEPWLQSFTGRKVTPLDPKPEQLDVRDIAHALSNLCRYTGHVARFYSVAEHSVRVAMFLLEGDPAPVTPGMDPQRLACFGLMHDASEAYLQDIPRPLKIQPAFAFYRAAEEKLQVMIYQAVGLTDPEPVEVKHADRVLLNTERLELLGPPPESWGEWPAPLPGPQGLGWDPVYAEGQFLRLFASLFKPAPEAKP